MSLPVNYQNEIINSAMANRRQYRMIENVNGTVSFIDVTVYDREGSLFDADDINAICGAINLNIENISTIQNTLENGVVNGIKGSAESTFRVGQVTLSAADIGTYSATEIDNLISVVGGMHFELVDALPTTNISASTIYLVPASSSKSRNAKDEYIYITEYSFTDVTTSCDAVADSESLPSVGIADIYYITLDDGKVYEWDSNNSEYVESQTYTSAIEVTTLPSTGSASVLYINTSDNTINSCTVTSEWEKIGSTSVDLSNYYTKTQIDSGALITTNEFNSLT